jgi:hypothetical protein
MIRHVSQTVLSNYRRQGIVPTAELLAVLSHTGLLIILPILPFFCWWASGDSSYVRQYGWGLSRAWHHCLAMARARVIQRALIDRWSPAPAEQVTGECTHCGRCCLFGDCMFLDVDTKGHSSCKIYTTRLWQGLTCGSYPQQQVDIDLYSCPSFTATPQRGEQQRPVVMMRRVD